MDKLIDSGLTPVTGTTPSGQRRLDPAAVLDLAAWPYAPAPVPSHSPHLAVHLTPLQPDSNRSEPRRSGRTSTTSLMVTRQEHHAVHGSSADGLIPPRPATAAERAPGRLVR
jgi:hypothetical protein